MQLITPSTHWFLWRMQFFPAWPLYSFIDFSHIFYISFFPRLSSIFFSGEFIFCQFESFSLNLPTVHILHHFRHIDPSLKIEWNLSLFPVPVNCAWDYWKRRAENLWRSEAKRLSLSYRFGSQKMPYSSYSTACMSLSIKMACVGIFHAIWHGSKWLILISIVYAGAQMKRKQFPHSHWCGHMWFMPPITID